VQACRGGDGGSGSLGGAGGGGRGGASMGIAFVGTEPDLNDASLTAALSGAGGGLGGNGNADANAGAAGVFAKKQAFP